MELGTKLGKQYDQNTMCDVLEELIAIYYIEV